MVASKSSTRRNVVGDVGTSEFQEFDASQPSEFEGSMQITNKENIAEQPQNKFSASDCNSIYEFKASLFERPMYSALILSLIHICRCRRIERCRSRWSTYN
eukprot:TRINITY_DN27580_c0_g1_i1.p2 TRINITY_DN27580_c0_g1~~TRINITY_DN27580_c0_g1_i1.p2  ORF type:complete len:101 (+),score=22.66 TRINITY_DN27580_c0_g1_i1:88-390(+)